MFCKKDYNCFHLKQKIIFALIILTAIMFTACGDEKDSDPSRNKQPVVLDDIAGTSKPESTGSIPGGNEAAGNPGNNNTAANQTGNSTSGNSTSSSQAAGSGTDDPSATAKSDDMKKKFGQDCISEQTFEVELSEYDGKVYFVPFAPSKNAPSFRMQIIQDGQVLRTISTYVPDKLSGKKFDSLDAVSFYDVNYDNNTDIVLIETYGGTTFAAVYYGFDDGPDNHDKGFMVEEQLSQNITDQLEIVSISEIRNLLAGGKKNGSFTDYREAYKAVSRLCDLESDGKMQYDLIYFDEDDIPELVADVNGYYTNLYTFHDGTLYTLMDHWGYGAMGNTGYDYVPKKNSLRNYNNDFAGAILYTTYMTIGARHTMDIVVQITTYNFDDVNQNGFPDEDELGSLGYYGVNYIDGIEASNDKCQSYSLGEYEPIRGTMSAEALDAVLNAS